MGSGFFCFEESHWCTNVSHAKGFNLSGGLALSFFGFLPDCVIQAGLPDCVIQAGLPDCVIQAGIIGM